MLTTSAYAGSFGIGATGSLAKISASGSEKEGTAADTSVNSIEVDKTSPIGSVFAEYTFDSMLGITLGVEHVPGSADVSDKTHTRNEVASGKAGEATDGTIDRSADAEVENLSTLYVEVPVYGMYLKAGVSQMDVNTLEKAQTDGGTYKNETITGTVVGLGMKSDQGSYFVKTSVQYTDFEELSISSSSNNSITADLDIAEFRISIGKAF
jgi:hypothetical protein